MQLVEDKSLTIPSHMTQLTQAQLSQAMLDTLGKDATEICEYLEDRDIIDYDANGFGAHYTLKLEIVTFEKDRHSEPDDTNPTSNLSSSFMFP
ncbi:MAG: hypothetical protein AB7F64_05425 [Gammaproteobacteria bacterium]